MLPETKFKTVLTKAFLTEILEEEVIEYHVSSGSKQGDNIAGSLTAVDIRTASRDIHHILIKTPPYAEPLQLFYVTHWRIFELEYTFYDDVVPRVNEMIDRRAGEHASRLHLPVPQYIAGSTDFLALHDLRPLGFKMANKYSGLDFPHVKLFMEKLGSFHASTYAFIRDCGESYFSEKNHSVLLGKLSTPPFHPERAEQMLNSFATSYRRAAEIVEDRNPALGAQMKKYDGKFGQIVRRLGQKVDVEHFPVISHGDIWVNNMIFEIDGGYDENGQPVEVPRDVVLLDFQQARRDSIFWDLLYFMYTSTTPEFRKQHLLSVLMIYYDSFVRTLNLLDVPLPVKFTRGWLVDEYFDNIPTAYVYMAFAIPLQLGDYSTLGITSPKPVPPNMIEDTESSWDRFATHAEEFPITLLRNTPAAQARLEAVTKEVNELGIFERF